MEDAKLDGPYHQVPDDVSKVKENVNATSEAKQPVLGSDGGSRVPDLRVLDNGL
jgi:hypothetical protein